MALAPPVAVEELTVDADAEAVEDAVPDCTRVGHAATRRRYLSSRAVCVGWAPKVVLGSDLTKVRSAWFWAWACAKAFCLGLVDADDVGGNDELFEEAVDDESGRMLGGEGERRIWKPAFVAALRSRRRMRARFASGVVAAPGAVAVEEVCRDLEDMLDMLEADEGQRLWCDAGPVEDEVDCSGPRTIMLGTCESSSISSGDSFVSSKIVVGVSGGKAFGP